MCDFEILNKERAFLGQVFRKIITNLEIVSSGKSIQKEEIAVLLDQLEDKAETISILDENIAEELMKKKISDEEFEDEWESVELYRNKLIRFKAKGYYTLNNHSKSTDFMSVSGESSTKRNFRLQRIELKKFNGDVRNWIGFWGQFKKIDEGETIDYEDNFQYMLQAMEEGSQARSLVESFPPSGENYVKALNQLKTRFARYSFLKRTLKLSLILCKYLCLFSRWFLSIKSKSETRITSDHQNLADETDNKIKWLMVRRSFCDYRPEV
ncbi:unnamed protein product [Phaedon cochleariae]|uniref:Uncharacterized protein n=1 Tax=Phaedon cochleariae TaxID=80249 RepID=A0A9N9SG93_PHACE|nr:unnamed protein product [Phaedon cochleariae]